MMKVAICLLVFLVFMVLFSSVVSADFAGDITPKVASVVCSFYTAFKSIATGIAALVMVIAGVKWVASENDPGARKAAKDAMIHAIVGLIIIGVIGSIIGMFASLGNLCNV
jgi:hypothetical protein